jgi:hypothetical protein
MNEQMEGDYPWTIENGNRAVIHFKNTTSHTVNALLVINFPDGTLYNPPAIVLRPFQSIPLDIQKLKYSKKPDLYGRAFPRDASRGQLQWRQVIPYSMIARLEETNMRQGIVRSFSYQDVTVPITSYPTISGPNTVWWFNGQNPNPAAYPTSITLTSTGGASTTWSVNEANAKISLSSMSGAQVSVSSSGGHFSGTAGDISIYVTAGGQQSTAFTITSKTPWRLVARGPSPACFASPQTYSTTLSYDVHDNFDTVMSADILME